MKKLIRLLKWLDDNLIKILLLIFIFLIPLYPKIPVKMINFTYIAIRLEDFYIVFLTIIFLIQILRKKHKLNWQFFILFSLYWLMVFLSSLWGIYIGKTIDIKHLGFLHALRRIEYMIVFFIALSAIKQKKDFFFYMTAIFLCLSIVNIYGIGQKFFGWPAVQTMNPEYAKGYLLFLTPEARISSTFAGHYDLAAYLIFFIPIIWGFYFFKNQIRYILLFTLSLITLVFTASRISYLAYLLSLFPFLIFLRKPKHLALAAVITLIFTFSSQNLTSRLKRTFQVKQIFINEKTGQVIVPQKITTKELPAGSFYLGLKEKTTSVTAEQEKLLKEKILEDVRKEAKIKGQKLTAEEEETILASLSAKLKPISTVVSDISFATRLQVEWPRAIKAFLKNPIFGTGPSSITEATDNDYLRSLGETGLLGTVFFGLIFIKLITSLFSSYLKIKDNQRLIFLSFIFGLFALLINAAYIDVFEASKVAYNFWLTAGLYIGYNQIQSKKQKEKI